MTLRGDRYYLRRHIPSDIQPIVGRSEVWRSLKTDSLQTALRRLPLIAAALETEFERIRNDAGLSVDQTLLRPCKDDLAPALSRQNTEQPETEVRAMVTLGEAYTRYIDDPTHCWSASTRQAYETTRRIAVSVIGADIAINSLARAHCREYLEMLRHLPRNAAKRFPKLTLREASQRAREQGGIELISAANANVHLANFSSFLNWAVNEELLARNPMRGLRLPDDVAKRDKRHPFGDEQLRAIFNAPLYRGCLDGERGYAKPGSARPRNARFWVPLIALHTGMRLNEICQLDTADIREIEGVQCFVVSEASLSGVRDKSLKTGASERLIPLHPALIESGILAFVEDQRRAKQVKLFPDIDPGPRGKRAVAFSKWFTQFLRACGASKPRTSFHSFRHNFRDELRAARIDHDIAMVLGGWTTGGNSSIASENYGGGHRVRALNEAMSKLAFADIDLSHLLCSVDQNPARLRSSGVS
ncbi:MAG: site-specific integrase [Pseudomonadota bacterium]|nr:site-specific integrase [Pseudomonadota bacterium]